MTIKDLLAQLTPIYTVASTTKNADEKRAKIIEAERIFEDIRKYGEAEKDSPQLEEFLPNQAEILNRWEWFNQERLNLKMAAMKKLPTYSAVLTLKQNQNLRGIMRLLQFKLSPESGTPENISEPTEDKKNNAVIFTGNVGQVRSFLFRAISDDLGSIGNLEIRRDDAEKTSQLILPPKSPAAAGR